MIRGILKLFTTTIGLISSLVTLCIVCGLIWLFCHVTGTPSPTDMIQQYGSSATSCMVNQAWGSLPEVDKATWESTHDLTQLGSDALRAIKGNADYCIGR
jgi:hypothetical protein